MDEQLIAELNIFIKQIKELADANNLSYDQMLNTYNTAQAKRAVDSAVELVESINSPFFKFKPRR